ncbi:MAG: OmpA family protein [Acidobacteriota bacterium]|nr:OmpA family protein [Acidobacteriota bacterium]
MGLGQQQIIIVKRKKAGHASHHGGAWKVAYADFVTAMMALFIVLWLLSSSEQVQKAVGGYFTDPKGHGKEIGNGLRGAGSESLSINKDDMKKLKEKLERAVKDVVSPENIRDHIVITVTGEGLRIEMIEDANGIFFESGNAMPTQYGKELLDVLAAEIGKLPNKVTIEGHTDSKPFNGRPDYSNWELSVDRANSARRWMQEHGMPPDQITQVRGFADQSLRDPQHPESPANRRVTMIIQYQNAPPASLKPPPGETGQGKSEPGKPEETRPGPKEAAVAKAPPSAK